jgi:hypothetical protein
VSAAKAYQSRVIDFADCWQKSPHTEQTIAIAENEVSPSDLIRVAHGTKIRHLVQKTNPHFDTECVTAEAMILHPQRFLADPLNTIFGTRSERAEFALTLQVTSKKSSVLTQFGDFVANLPRSRTIWDQSLLVADELFTNSAKNGWDPSVKPFATPPQFQGSIDFFAQADTKRLVIGCRDSFGTLDVWSVIARIANCYEKGLADSIQRGSAGAGIGSFMVFESCLSYYLAVEKNCQTVVCVALPLGYSRRAGAGLAKNIHLLP